MSFDKKFFWATKVICAVLCFLGIFGAGEVCVASYVGQGDDLINPGAEAGTGETGGGVCTHEGWCWTSSGGVGWIYVKLDASADNSINIDSNDSKSYQIIIKGMETSDGTFETTIDKNCWEWGGVYILMATAYGYNYTTNSGISVGGISLKKLFANGSEVVDNATLEPSSYQWFNEMNPFHAIVEGDVLKEWSNNYFYYYDGYGALHQSPAAIVENGRVAWGDVYEAFQEALAAAQSNGNTDFADSWSWSTTSDLTWFCYGDSTAVQSRSGVGENTSDYQYTAYNGTTTKTVKVNQGQSQQVCFTHVIAILLEDKDKSGVTITWRTVNGDAYGENINTSFATKNGSFAMNSPPSAYYEASSDKVETVVVSGVCQTIKVDTTTKICQTIYYTPTSYAITMDNKVEDSSDGTEGHSTACIVLEATDPDPPDPCASSTYGYYNSAYYGSDGAYTAVVNWTANKSSYKSWNYAAKDKATATVWAKPGDSITFAHCVAVGGQYVMGTTSGTSSERFGKSEKPQTEFSITAKLDGSTNSKFAFGNRNIVSSTATITLKRFGTSSSSSDQPIAADSTYNYGGVLNANLLGGSDNFKTYMGQSSATKSTFIVFSPATTNNDTSSMSTDYSCKVYDFAQNYFDPSGSKNYTPRVWQAQGLRSSLASSCKAYSSTSKSSVVGSEVSQTLTFNRVNVWTISDSSNITGSCDCDEDERGWDEYGAKSDWSNYPSAYSKSYNNGYWRKGTYYDSDEYMSACKSNGKCCPDMTCGPSHDECCGWYTEYKNNDPSSKYYVVRYNEVVETRTASVKIPYNFDTADFTSSIISGDDDAVVYLGEAVDSTFTFDITPRTNSDVGGNYATITPDDTLVQIVAFILDIDDLDDYDQLEENDDTGFTGSDLCSFYDYDYDCAVIAQYKGSLNGEGLYGGASYDTGTITTIVPDDDNDLVGMKYCVAIGVNYTNSHVNSSKQGLGTLTKSWHTSGVSCRTIAKKPNFEVWGAGVYATAGVRASTSNKYTGLSGVDYYVSGSSTEISSDDDADLSLTYKATKKTTSATTVYGSWAEYEIISYSIVRGIASAAALGYNGLSRSTLSSSGYYCRLAYMTVANNTTNCKYSSGNAGNSNILVDDSTFLARFEARYKPTDAVYNAAGYASGWIDNNTVYYASKNSSTYLSTMLSQFTGTKNELNSYAYYRHTLTWSNNNTGTSDERRAQTMIIYVQGTLFVDRNICVGVNTGTCDDSGSQTKLVLNARNTEAYSSLSGLSQVIIFADNIYITENVTQIDAWLVANSSSGNYGRLSTCYLDDYATLNSNVCDKTLIINGPVFADNIFLGRTAGANVKSASSSITASTSLGQFDSNYGSLGSMTPAEIFNFRSDIIFWMYNQMQNYSEASVTYTRELSPRY